MRLQIDICRILTNYKFIYTFKVQLMIRSLILQNIAPFMFLQT
jgi:hypothetical protein